MQKEMQYWEGLAVGVLTGLAITAFIRWENINPWLMPDFAPAAPDLADASPAVRSKPNLISPISLRRDHPESAGDPSSLTSAATPLNPPVFERAGGAPSPNTPAELVGTPGRPGQSRDLSDPTLPVSPSPRNINLNRS